MEYVNVPVPPEAVTVMAPLVEVAQLKSAPLYEVFTALLILTAEGAVMVTEVAEDVHKLASLTTI